MVNALHHLLVVAYVYVVVETHKRVFLFGDGLDGFLRFYHEGEHLGIVVGVVGFKAT